MSADVPTDVPRRRFKRRYVVVGITLLALAGLVMGWMDRPLTAEEARLVGAWIRRPSDAQGFVFRADRSLREVFLIDGQARVLRDNPGSWRLQNERLTIKYHQTLIAPTLWGRISVRLDQMTWGGLTKDLIMIDDDTLLWGETQYYRVPAP